MNATTYRPEQANNPQLYKFLIHKDCFCEIVSRENGKILGTAYVVQGMPFIIDQSLVLDAAVENREIVEWDEDGVVFEGERLTYRDGQPDGMESTTNNWSIDDFFAYLDGESEILSELLIQALKTWLEAEAAERVENLAIYSINPHHLPKGIQDLDWLLKFAS